MMAVDKRSGLLVWKTLLDSHTAAQITGSAVEFGGKIYVGVSSNQEGLAAADPKFVLSFRGSVVSLDAQTGNIEWQTFMVPEGYTGGAVWGSNLSIDPKRHSLYVGTGNNYSVPKAVAACVANAKTVSEQFQCLDPEDFVAGSLSGDMVAIDGNSGAILWKFASGGSVICGPSIVNGTVFWGSGYRIGKGNNKLFAFSLRKGHDRKLEGDDQ
jgi:polyvinyl alcohol dehydrogenase (cytochrome)